MTAAEIPVQGTASPDADQGTIRDHLVGVHEWTFLDIATNTERLDLLHQFEHAEAALGLIEMHHDHACDGNNRIDSTSRA